MKRALDILLSATGLVLLTPVFAAVALGLRREGSGPVLFRQVRVGRGFRPFHILKFRTMVPGADRMGPGITPGRDPRVTPFGAFLRWTKLDELPQLWNVLRGDMSLVGPRPELPQYARMFEDDYREILRVRPGITDLASLAYRDEAGRLDHEPDPERAYVESILPDKIRLARTYVSRASFGYDLKIIGETLLLLTFPSRALDRLLERFAAAHRQVALVVQVALAAAANLLAMWLIYDGGLTQETLSLVLLALPTLLAVRTLWHVVFHLDRDRWRYVGMREIGDVVAATALGTGTFWLITQLVPVFQGYPRAIVIVDGVLCLLLLSGARIVRRGLCALRERTYDTRSALVVGAGDAAERVVRELLQNPGQRYEVVGIIGGTGDETGLRVHEVPILGGFDALERVLAACAPDEVVLVRAGIPEERFDEVTRASHAHGAAVRVVGEDGSAVLESTKADLTVPRAEDLLFRDAVEVDLETVRPSYEGRRVLVTGAGGSIGSEISRQLAACGPSCLLLFEKHEASLYHIERELRARHPGLRIEPVLGDVTEEERVEDVFRRARPEVVFHAAAYKHVPMLELNPIEGYKTNAEGTRIVAEVSDRTGVGTFVLISTDKAVEPVSVLGASKRMAELAVQEIAGRSSTRCMAVRFGNVLESSGSVVPLFKEQIENGGPITVTHFEATRWFMTVPEAVQLILEAATMGQGGEVFVLDMGKPVRIVDLAHALARRYGLRPGRDIEITFTGLRPGERLFEKLFNDHEQVWKTRHPRILMAADLPSRREAGGAAESARLRAFIDQATRSGDGRLEAVSADEDQGVCA